MKISEINKYILAHIFSYISFKKELSLIKYNKRIMKKLDITKYTYLKRYFISIINPAILENPSILLNNNIFDKKAIEKLMSDWKEETTEIFDGNNFFIKITDIKIFESFKKIEKSPKMKLPNLIELNLSDLNNFEIPCVILSNLEAFSLKNMYGIKFLSNDSNISLDKLKKLYIDNISLNNQNENLKIKVDNLKYLDLRFNQIEDGKKEDNEEENGENEDEEKGDKAIDNYNYILSKKYSIKDGFIKTNTIEDIAKIFDFNFLSVFQISQEILECEEDFFPDERFKEVNEIFTKPDELFKESILKKLDYFNLEIFYRLNYYSGSTEFTQGFTNQYLFSKTKGNKYIFKTIYKNAVLLSDDSEIEYVQKELRYCNEINYNNYYYINKDVEVWGYGEFGKEKLNCENINTLKIFDKKDYGNYSDFSIILNYFKSKNKNLKIISLDYLKAKDADNLIKNIKKFIGLNCLYIKNCLMDNKQLIKLFQNLSQLKLLFCIQITSENNCKFSKALKEKISKLFPNISIENNKKGSSIKWINNNIMFN